MRSVLALLIAAGVGFGLGRFRVRDQAVSSASLEPRLRMTADFKRVPLAQILEQLRWQVQPELDVDWPACEAAGLHPDTPVSVMRSVGSLREILSLVTVDGQQVPLDVYFIETSGHAVWRIAPQSFIETHAKELRIYDLSPLLRQLRARLVVPRGVSATKANQLAMLQAERVLTESIDIDRFEGDGTSPPELGDIYAGFCTFRGSDEAHRLFRQSLTRIEAALDAH